MLSGEGNVDSASASQSALVKALSELDPDSEEGRAIRNSIGEQGDAGRGLLAAASYRSQTERSLSGNGRRGIRQRNETAFSMATGGTFGMMDLNFRGRHIRGASQFLRAVQHGRPEEREQLMRDFRGGLEGFGIDRGTADELTNMFKDNKLDETERDRLREIGSSDKVREARRHAVESQQAQQNPLDASCSPRRNATVPPRWHWARSSGGSPVTVRHWIIPMCAKR